MDTGKISACLRCQAFFSGTFATFEEPKESLKLSYILCYFYIRLLDFYLAQTWRVCLNSSSCSQNVLLKEQFQGLLKISKTFSTDITTLRSFWEKDLRITLGIIIGRAWINQEFPGYLIYLQCTLRIWYQSGVSDHLELLGCGMRQRMTIKNRINIKQIP